MVGGYPLQGSNFMIQAKLKATLLFHAPKMNWVSQEEKMAKVYCEIDVW